MTAAELDSPAAAPAAKPRGGFLGHPAGLGYLAFTEAWERFSFYGMQAILVLYMVDRLLLPGHIEHVVGFAAFRGGLEGIFGPLSGQALASQVFGLYSSAVYITPIIGGWLGDNVLGRRGAITLGAATMAVGHFLMAIEGAFLVALACLILGCGLMKGNIAAQVGGLYAEGDKRRDDAFQIFILSINAGVIAAPLVCGTLGEKVGFHWGFGAAGVGMLVAIAIYLSGYRHLPPDQVSQRKAGPAPMAPLSAHEWRALVGLIVLVPVLALAYVGNNQMFNAYMVWARDSVDLNLGGFRMPVTWLASIDSILSMICLVAVVAFWRWMAARGFAPSELFKIALGCVFWVTPFAMLTVMAWFNTRTGWLAPLPLIVVFHILNELAYANVLPVSLALYSRASPPRLTATMISVAYTLFVITNFLVGWVGSYYEKMSHTAFWAVHAGFCAASGVLILILYRPLSRAFAPAAAPA